MMKPVVRLSSILLVAVAVAASDSPLIRGSERGGGDGGETLRMPIPGGSDSSGSDSCPSISLSGSDDCGNSGSTVDECNSAGGSCCVYDSYFGAYECEAYDQLGEEKLALMS